MGHGHVVPNLDGSKARCGGPGICTDCSMEEKEMFRQAEKSSRPLYATEEKLRILQDASMMALGWIMGKGEMGTVPCVLASALQTSGVQSPYIDVLLRRSQG